MKSKQIAFISEGTAGLEDIEVSVKGEHDVLVRTEYTVVSAGTERANLMGMDNTTGTTITTVKFPRVLGYCGIGRVEEIGSRVTSVVPGDRVIIYFGSHRTWNVVPEKQVIRITDESLPSIEAAHTVIAQISLGGVRKARLCLGESVLIQGMGILGIYAVQLARMDGAIPVIASDFDPERRALALQLGADYALDPADPSFADTVRKLTGSGVNAVIEGTGNAAALKQALSCVAREGRVVLLGCTRRSNCPIDFYREVHACGVELIGAHTCVRPEVDSRRDCWSYRDDCNVILKLLSSKRLTTITSEIHKPEEAPDVYTRLAQGAGFPIGVVFDWR